MAESVNIYNILYLVFRLAPFIVVVSFLLQSVLNWDIRGIVYLVGLGLACFVNITANKYVKPLNIVDPIIHARCGILSLGPNGTMYSKYPLSITTYGYTFFYIFYWIVKMAQRTSSDGLGNVQKADLASAIKYNIPTFIVFPLLILLESIWINVHKCSPNWIYIFGSLVIGGVVGLFYAYIVSKLSPNMQIVSGGSNMDVCNRQSKVLYKCKARS